MFTSGALPRLLVQLHVTSYLIVQVIFKLHCQHSIVYYNTAPGNIRPNGNLCKSFSRPRLPRTAVDLQIGFRRRIKRMVTICVHGDISEVIYCRTWSFREAAMHGPFRSPTKPPSRQSARADLQFCIMEYTILDGKKTIFGEKRTIYDMFCMHDHCLRNYRTFCLFVR